MEWDRPFKNLDEQIHILRSKNVTIRVQDEIYAKDILALVPYHTLLNGYKDLYEIEREYFKDGTTIEVLFITHTLYSTFNSLILKYILYVEKSLKSSIGYSVAKKYGVYTDTDPIEYGKKVPVSRNSNDYLGLSNYDGSQSPIRILASIVKMVRNPYKNSLVSHYSKTKNHIPPWIVANDLSFGKTVNWYKILNSEIKNDIVHDFLKDHLLSELHLSQKKEYFIQAFDQLVQYRDRIAHANKTCSLKLKKHIPQFIFDSIWSKNKLVSQKHFNSGLGRNDIYSVILSVFVLLNNKVLIASFYLELVVLIESNNTIYVDLDIYEVLGLPKDFINLIHNFLIKELKMDPSDLIL